MNAGALREERLKNLIDATSFVEPKKVPVTVEMGGWTYTYVGTTYAEVIDHPKRAADDYLKFLDVIEIDCMRGGPATVPIKAYQALGRNDYSIADDGIATQHQQAFEEYMRDDEYPDLIRDPAGFMRKWGLRKYESLSKPREEAYEDIKKALIDYKNFMMTTMMIRKRMENEKGVVWFDGRSAPVGYYTPLSGLFSYYRGVKNTLLDLRRKPEVLREACSALMQIVKARIGTHDPGVPMSPFPFGFAGYHPEGFLSPEQFDEFFFNNFKELCMPFMEAGLKFFIQGEGSFIHHVDRYRQLPKGSCYIMLDDDDPFEIYKVIGDWQPIGAGITIELLSYGTKQDCVDYVKKCFDTFAPGGGFVFRTSKPIMCATDAKIENVVAVYETANELSRQ